MQRRAHLLSFQRHFVRHHDGRPGGRRHLRRRGVVLPPESEDEEEEQNRGGDLQLGVAREGGGLRRPRPKLKVKKHLSPLNWNLYSAGGGGHEDFGRQQRRQQPDGGCNYTNLHDWHEGAGGGGRAGRAASASNESPPPEYAEAIKF